MIPPRVGSPPQALTLAFLMRMTANGSKVLKQRALNLKHLWWWWNVIDLRNDQYPA